ncbi:hypothetical protein BGX27_008432 [Mortierella sp. AM989]|nr:hypothetical protein BGX27_008432 [Mortierella sp. AM989]
MTVDNRASIGIWGGSKSAASSPNLTNLSKNNDLFGPYPVQGPVSMGSTPASASVSKPSPSSISGEKSYSSSQDTASSPSSFQQRRKRSESIGGLKTFDDKDAPPIPVTPHHSNNSTVSHHSASSASIGNSYVSYITSTNMPVPDLPPLPSKHPSGLGPIDNPASGAENSIATITPTSTPPTSSSGSRLEPDQELSKSVSNIELWLERSQMDPKDTPPTAREVEATYTVSPNSSVHITSDSTTPVTKTTRIQGHRPSQGFRRPSHTPTVSTMDDDDSEIEDIVVPISVLTLNSNRLSRIHEAGSTPSNENDEQGNGGNDGSLPSKRLTADLTRNSILFSEFGLMVSKALPSMPNLNLSLGRLDHDKPLPRRPVSMFSPTSSSASTFLYHDDTEAAGIIAKEAIGQEIDNINRVSPVIPDVIAHGTSSNLDHHHPSNPIGEGSQHEQPSRVFNLSLGVPGPGPAGVRPATICVSAEDAHKITPATQQLSVTFLPISMHTPPAEQKEGTEALALSTSIRCFQEDSSFLRCDEISVYLGQAKPFNRLVLNLYMSNFDFSRKRLDVAFRQLCQKLVLKGETQEVDRVLEAFAHRYVDCNPQSIFGSEDVVHAITYSILLLNTDLHVVQQSSLNKMSRSAFVKNTLQVVQGQSSQQVDGRASEDISSYGIPFTRSTTDEIGAYGGKKRTPSIKSWKSGTSYQSKSSKMGPDPKANGGHGNGKWWMSELESLLKDIYSSVKHNQILLPSTTLRSGSTLANSGASMSSNRASPGGSNFLPRMSKQINPSSFAETSLGVSGASGDNNHGGIGNNNAAPTFGVTGRRNSVNARTKQLRQDALQRLNAQPSEETTPFGKSSTTETGINEVRPGNSSRSLASTLTPPTSSSSFNTHLTNSTLPSPVSSVFSNNEMQLNTPSSSGRSLQPAHQVRFRMEGILFRKHLLERADKKASNRSWRQLLVVVDQGGLSLFRADGQLGQAFEEQGILFDEIRLQHTITNILPPPGYSSSRKHVFAVQLYTGAVYLFQASSARDCEEWARTCNYWAARTSKEPLVGGVVNMDYGWGRSLDLLSDSSTDGGDGALSNSMKFMASSHSISSLSSPNLATSNSTTQSPAGSNSPSSSSVAILDLIEDDDAKSENNSISAGTSYLQHPPPPPASSAGSGIGIGATSYYGFGNSGVGSGRSASIKSSSSKYSGVNGSNVPLGDRIMLFEWAPPLPTMSMTLLSEEDQCEGLKRYVVGLEAEMEIHQEHRGPMLRLFLPKSHNYSKAFNNWERRSRYLLKEMVKYQIYVECLEQSLQAQEEERKAAAEAELEDELQHLEVNEDEDDFQGVEITVNGDPFQI